MTARQISERFKISVDRVYEAISSLGLPSKRGRTGYDYTEEQLKQIHKEAMSIERRKKKVADKRREDAEKAEKEDEEKESKLEIVTKQDAEEAEAKLVNDFTIDDDESDSIFDILEEIEEV